MYALDSAPVAGDYAVADAALRFTPMFPLEPGRTYTALFDPAAIPGGANDGATKVSRVLSVPAAAPSAPVTVASVYPSDRTVPANLLRMYVEFSGPMGSRGRQAYITPTNAREMLKKIDFLRGTSPWILMDFRSPRRVLPAVQDNYNRKGLSVGQGREEESVLCPEGLLPPTSPGPARAVTPARTATLASAAVPPERARPRRHLLPRS